MDDASDRHRLTSRNRRRLAVLPSEWTRLRPPFRPSASPFVSSPRVATIRRCHLHLFPPVTFDIFSKRHSHAQIARGKKEKKKEDDSMPMQELELWRGGQGKGKKGLAASFTRDLLCCTHVASNDPIAFCFPRYAEYETDMRTSYNGKAKKSRDEKVRARFNREEQTCESGAYRNVVDGYIYIYIYI